MLLAMAAGVVWLFRLMVAVAAMQASATQPDRVALKPMSQRSLLTNPSFLSRYGFFQKTWLSAMTPNKDAPGRCYSTQRLQKNIAPSSLVITAQLLC